MSKDIVSHGVFSSYNEAVAEIKSRIGDNSYLNNLLEQLEGCSFGKFLIQNRGLDAYWTKKVTENKDNYENEFEQKLISLPPVFVATQQRSLVFKKYVAELPCGANIMSVPAGLLPEFTQNLIESKGFRIDAYDLDKNCANQTELSKLENVNYIVDDIFEVDVKEIYDAVVSNGLNIYLESDQQVQKFYDVVCQSLNSKGVLITSFLKDASEIDLNNTGKDNISFAKSVFIDILNIGWKKTHKEQDFCQILSNSGFDISEIIYDSQKMFPTIVATKK